ncbi:hypothetical protein [Williamsia sp. D3]|uniref:hypothetical protein n=1 Tax=Williamsia sp. D3 TaxID=1313067 RepID=UPI0003D30C93|nr:hypothetical protein [Williamsia sp. D3]ETD32241.1 hypothetical protein W823_14760 [Williamsia sp. D3]
MSIWIALAILAVTVPISLAGSLLICRVFILPNEPVHQTIRTTHPAKAISGVLLVCLAFAMAGAGIVVAERFL